MKRTWILIAVLLLSAVPADAQAPRTCGERLADSILAEYPDAWKMRKSDGEYRWSYTVGLVTYGMYKLHLKHDEPGYYAYMKANVDWDEATVRAHIRNVCRSAGLGGEPYRDGSYDYYVSTDVVSDDAHGVGAFLLASSEIE